MASKYFENVYIKPSAQGKHIPGHNSYETLLPDKKMKSSIFTHSDPDALLKKYAGKGLPEDSRMIPGKTGYKEIVDFEEFIGYYVDRNTKEKILTTKGKIHYDTKGGAHIVPDKPN